MPLLNTTKVYADLRKIKISLEPQDIPHPNYIQAKLSECSLYQDQLEKFVIDATEELSTKSCLFRTEQYNIECKKRDILTNVDDFPKVKRLTTGKEREYAADVLLEEDHKKLLALENDTNLLRDVLGAIKVVQSNLNRKSADLKVMARLMEQQIGRLGIGVKDDPSMAEMAKNIAYLNTLDKEMTVDDVSEISEYIETEESAGESDAEAKQTPTATDDRDSEEIGESGIAITMDLGNESADESDAKAKQTPTATDNQDQESKSEASSKKEEEVDDVLTSFLTDTADDVSEDDSDEGSSGDESSEEEKTEVTVSHEAAEDGTITIRGEVDLDLSELGISLDDSVPVEKKQPEKAAESKKTESKPAEKTSAEKSSTKKAVTSTNKKEEKPPVQTSKPPTNVTEPTKQTESDASEIDLDSILDNLR